MATEIAQPPAAKPGEATVSFLEDFVHGENRKKSKPAEPTKPAEPDKKEPEKKEPEAVKPPDKKPDEKPLVTPTTTPAPPAAPVMPPVPAMTADKIAEAAARGTAEALKKAEKPAAPAPDDVDLDDEEKEMRDDLAHLEKAYPQYKGISDKYVKSLKAADDWQTQWEKAHPGEAFDPDTNEDFQKFSEKNSVEYSPNHLAKAIAKREVDRVEQKHKDKETQAEQERSAQDKLHKAAPQIIAQRNDASKDFFAQLGDEFKTVLDELGEFNNEAIKKLIDADPLKRAFFEANKAVENFSMEFYQLSTALKSFDEKNPFHAAIADFYAENENYLTGLDYAKQQEFVESLPERLRGEKRGRLFVSASQYREIPENQRARYFRLNHKDIAYLYGLSEANRVKKEIESEEKSRLEWAEKRGLKKVEGAPATPTPAAPQPPEPPKPQSQPPSPSGSVAPLQTLQPGHKPASGEKPADSFARMFIG